LYSADDVTEIAVLCALRKKGFPLQRVRRIMKFLQKEFSGRLAQAVSTGSEYHLLTDGKRIYVENSQSQVIDILKNSRQPLLGVCLSDAVRDVRTELFSRRPAQQQQLRRSAKRKSS
jgi:DNA-binding transcriptional MerR regulator